MPGESSHVNEVFAVVWGSRLSEASILPARAQDVKPACTIKPRALHIYIYIYIYIYMYF